MPLPGESVCAAGAPVPEPLWDDQYGPNRTGADVAWEMTRGNTSVAVCVVDSGVQLSHEDIGTTQWLGGWDFVSNHALTGDNTGHGSTATGVAAATIDNGKGMAGIGNVGIYGAKVLPSNGLGSEEIAAEGIIWCADQSHPRIVINLSLSAGDIPKLQHRYWFLRRLAWARRAQRPGPNVSRTPRHPTRPVIGPACPYVHREAAP